LNQSAWTSINYPIQIKLDWLIDCCLTPTQQFVIYTSVITVRTDLIIQLGPELKEPRAVVIYGSLFKYTQQYTEVLQRTIGPPVPPKTGHDNSKYVPVFCVQITGDHSKCTPCLLTGYSQYKQILTPIEINRAQYS
jgi:hypothetical protein